MGVQETATGARHVGAYVKNERVMQELAAEIKRLAAASPQQAEALRQALEREAAAKTGRPAGGAGASSEGGSGAVALAVGENVAIAFRRSQQCAWS